MKKWVTAVATIALCAVVLLLRIVLPHRAFMWCCMLCSLLSLLGIAVIASLKKGQKMANWIAALSVLATFGAFFSLSRSYAFVDSAFLPFWPISLTVGVLAGLFLTFVLFRGEKWWVGALCGAVICFVLVVVTDTYIQNLNYLLDTDEPLSYAAVIEEKDMDIHTKGPDTYEFRVAVNGEAVWLEVSEREYDIYAVGDIYNFSYYNGAFGKAFYLS